MFVGTMTMYISILSIYTIYFLVVKLNGVHMPRRSHEKVPCCNSIIQDVSALTKPNYVSEYEIVNIVCIRVLKYEIYFLIYIPCIGRYFMQMYYVCILRIFF